MFLALYFEKKLQKGIEPFHNPFILVDFNSEYFKKQVIQQTCNNFFVITVGNFVVVQSKIGSFGYPFQTISMNKSLR